MGVRPPELYGVPKIHKKEPLKGPPSATLEPLTTSCPSISQACSANMWGVKHHVKNSTPCIHTLDSLIHLTGGLHGQLQHGVLFTILPFREAQNFFRQHFEGDKLGLF